MIRYTPQNQLSFENFKTPFENHLDPNNRWVKLAERLPWDELAKIYYESLSSDQGRPTLDARLAIGAIIVKHRLNLSDQEAIEMIQENIYIQFFVGFSSFNPRPAFDASLFVSLRKRIGAEEFDQMSCRIIEKAKGIKKTKDDDNPKTPPETSDSKEVIPEMVKNQGQLKLDATVADQMIDYPTDLKLLNTAREESERIIDVLYKKLNLKLKPRTYCRNARKAFLAIAKKRRRTQKEIRKGIGQQLRYLRRNLNTIEKLLDQLPVQPFPLKFRDLKIYWVIQLLYDQQSHMYKNKVKSHPDRIVSIYQPYVRPIPRGKDKGLIEFGAKIGVSEFDGFCRVNHISWDAYHEASDLISQVEAYKKLFGYYPEVVLTDKIYLTRANRQWLKSHGIRHIGKPLGKPKTLSDYFKRKLRRERNSRNHIEGKFGQGKNGYELNQIRARRSDTSESWITAIFMVMNLVRWMKVDLIVIWGVVCQIAWWLINFLSRCACSQSSSGIRGLIPGFVMARN